MKMTNAQSMIRPTAEAIAAMPAVEVTEEMRDRSIWFPTRSKGEAAGDGIEGDATGLFDGDDGSEGGGGVGGAGAGEAAGGPAMMTLLDVTFEMDSKVNPRVSPAAAAPAFARFVSELLTPTRMFTVSADISTAT